MLTLIDLVGLLPLLIVASTAVLVMLGVAWRRHHGGTAAVTVSGLALALASLPLASAAPSSPRPCRKLRILCRHSRWHRRRLPNGSKPTTIKLRSRRYGRPSRLSNAGEC